MKWLSRTIDQFHCFLFSSKLGNALCVLLIATCSSFLIYKICVLPPIVHPELLVTFPQLINHEGQSFIEGLYGKTFNLLIVEDRGYRPRALGYLIGYIEPNLIIWINSFFQDWGIRQPFVYLGALLFVFMSARLIRHFFSSIPWSAATLIGTSQLFFINVSTSFFTFHGRSAKVLTFSAVVGLIEFYLVQVQKELSKRQVFYSLALVPFIFVLGTLDELVLGSLVCLMIISVLKVIVERKINSAAFIFSFASALYASFHIYWGRALFQHFTKGGLVVHMHNFDQILSGLSLDNFTSSLQIMAHFAESFFSNILILMIVLMTSVFVWFRVREWADRSIILVMVATAIFINMATIVSHPSIYGYRDVWNRSYQVPSMIFLLVGWMMLLSKAPERMRKGVEIFLFVTMFVSGGLNAFSLDKAHLNYLKLHGGHLELIPSHYYHGMKDVDPKLFKNVMRGIPYAAF